MTMTMFSSTTSPVQSLRPTWHLILHHIFLQKQHRYQQLTFEEFFVHDLTVKECHLLLRIKLFSLFDEAISFGLKRDISKLSTIFVFGG